jgi:phage terminase large subunit GpA-like protein
MLPNGMPTNGYTLEYFEEITAEQRELTYDRHGFARYEWTKNRTDPNEAFDCRVYARAALEYLRVKLEQMPKDVLANFPEQDIDRVEIGLGRIIHVDKSKRMDRKAVNQYGAKPSGTAIREEGEGYVPTTTGFRREERQTSRYGAISTSF